MTERLAFAPASDVPVVRLIGVHDLTWALRMGFKDFLAAPRCGLGVSAVFVVGGLALIWVLAQLGQLWLAVPAAAGFPILGPFAAVGLYEVSRQRERGRTAEMPEILATVFRQKDRQIPSMAAVLVFCFLFWNFLAHMIFALFLGVSAMVNVSSSWEVFLTPNGLTMIAVELAVGAVFAAVLFSLSVISLPLLLDREVDFVTAMVTSLSCVVANPGTLLSWGALCAGLLFLGMIPGFLGLFVVLPVLGHASWHLYRRALEPDARPIRTARATVSDVRG
ncbi:DUF2189 domain-containing protein [Acidimangrovimonas sediminis]|uniref:DUF2189 domain-containing protein n=1 Tax=Acidimangrovimonas sediminis TaxID=2056283 RepID=UPI000C80D8E3|nr:DUF2189 domain-containing protein [Acidimangrovimonas sediminis]